MNIWLISLLAVWLFINLAYLASRVLKRNDIMDILWGLGFSMLTILNLSLTAYYPIWKIVLSSLVILWSIRLSLHIILKNSGKPEDFRYQNWRKSWGKTEWWRSYLQIYLLQGFFMFVIALPIIGLLSKSFLPFSFPKQNLMYFPVIVAVLGLLIESIADYQKTVFKKTNASGLMKTGLWKYSRHPNYFGEAMFWWGIALLSFVDTYLIYGIISATVITVLLRYVSGVPMLEKAKEGNAAYEQYKKETPVFVPFLKSGKKITN
jgi:steroid 5-alpha reductase family enzyme